MTYSLTNMTTLGTVNSEEVVKDAQLFQMPMPASNSSAALLLDLFGAFRTITIKGTFVVGDGGLTIAQFIGQLDALANGNQAKRTYYSDKSATSYGVYVQTVRWSGEEAAVSQVDYELTLYEGA